MTLRVLRVDGTAFRTIGLLLVDGRFDCYTLEDALRLGPKVPGATAIPPGTYQVVITPSARFGRDLPLLVNVPGFTGIRIHAGNTDADTDGCLLVGMGRTADAVTESRSALALLQKQIADALARGDVVSIAVENVLG